MIKEVKRFIRSLIEQHLDKQRQHNSFDNRVSRHFLFNALNAVITLCRQNPAAAADLVVDISTYLQRSLEDKEFIIPLDEELEQVISYLNIQKTRFADRLTIEVEIEPGLQGSIPAFTLQPLVDNAIIHGVLKRKGGGWVNLSIKRRPSCIRISVRDDGVGMTTDQLASLFKRGNQHRSLYRVNRNLKKAGFKALEIKSAPNAGTTVSLEIPISPG
ncbi:MAG: sensor histidine kinase [Bacillota bacterium]